MLPLFFCACPICQALIEYIRNIKYTVQMPDTAERIHMKKRSICLLLAALLSVMLLPLGVFADSSVSGGQPGADSPDDTVYTVTLDPGEGDGEPIVFCSADQFEITYGREERHFVESFECEFYYYSEDSPWMCFQFDGTYCPYDWEPPSGKRFGGWDVENDIILTSQNTQINVVWIDSESKGFSYQMVPRSLSLNPGATYYDVAVPEAYMGRRAYVANEYGDYEQCVKIGSLGFLFYSGTLSDENGNTIPFSVGRDVGWLDEYILISPLNEMAYDALNCITTMVYVDPEACSAAPPGVYTGEMEYAECANDGMSEFGRDSVSLRLVISDADFDAEVYNVTFWPGDGSGEPVTFSSKDQEEIPIGFWSAGNCQFYREGQKMFFRLDHFYPDSFTAPQGYKFRGWNRDGDIELSSQETSVTAFWDVDSSTLPEASFSLTATSGELKGERTEIAVMADELTPGRVSFADDDFVASALIIESWEGELSNGEGNTIPFRTEDHTDYRGRLDFQGMMPIRKRLENGIITVCLDSGALESASPGVYTGELVCYVRWWDADGRTWGIDPEEDPFYIIPLTLTVGSVETAPGSSLQPDLYEITQGGGSEWVQDSSEGLTFTSDADFSKFVSVQVDQNTLDPAYYTAEPGSTKVTVSSAYLQLLTPGIHTITIQSTDGGASASFAIASTPGANQYIPQTGDGGPSLWIALMCASLAGLAVTARKKKI